MKTSLKILALTTIVGLPFQALSHNEKQGQSGETAVPCDRKCRIDSIENATNTRWLNIEGSIPSNTWANRKIKIEPSKTNSVDDIIISFVDESNEKRANTGGSFGSHKDVSSIEKVPGGMRVIYNYESPNGEKICKHKLTLDISDQYDVTQISNSSTKKEKTFFYFIEHLDEKACHEKMSEQAFLTHQSSSGGGRD